MWVVGLKTDVVLAHGTQVDQAMMICGEAAKDAIPVVVRWGLGDAFFCMHPSIVMLPDRVSTLKDIWDPSDLAL